MQKLQKVTSEDFVKLRFITHADLSPDASKIVFTIKNVDEEKNQYKSAIYLKELSEDKYYKYSAGTQVDTNPKFSPDGNKLAFLSSRGESGLQLYCMKVSGGEAFPLTNFPAGIMNFTWDHNSEVIHFIARVNKEELKGIERRKDPFSYVLSPLDFVANKAKKEEEKKIKIDPRIISEAYCREGTSYLDGRFSQPFIVSLEGFNYDDCLKKPNKIKHIGEFGYHYSLGVFTKDSQSIVLSRFIGDPALNLKQVVIKVPIKEPTHSKELGMAFGWVDNFKISPDGKYVSFEALREEIGIYDDIQIFLIDLQSESSFKCLTLGFQRSAYQSDWLDSDTILFLSTNEGRINIHRINVYSKETKLVCGGDRNINLFTIVPGSERIIFEVSSQEFPSDLFIGWITSGKESRITNVNEEYLKTHETAVVKEIHYENDNIEQQAWLMLPRNYDPKNKVPVVLEVHGGPAAMWSPHENTMWHEWNTIVSKGYAVVFCNPRGSDGYGKDFRGACFKNWGHLPQSDILKALEVVLKEYSALDQENVFLTGGSYGGYMTAWLVTQTHRFKAAVSQRGVYEFIGFGLTTDIPLWFERQYDGEILKNFAKIWEDQPIAHVPNIATPLLILHSENDFRVPIVTAETLFFLCKRYGKEVEFVRYPRDGHELSRSGEPRHIVDRINRICNWFEKYNK
ncbi:MAG: S9 family peptidase [Candidatus Hodarchaeales archaeon]